jgi:two-component system cell cycle response regulator
MKILIVEPSKIIQLSIESIFKDYATTVFTCRSGAEAIKIYNEISIDLICLSFYLLDVDGLELVSWVREQRFGNTIPILLITSKESQEATAKGFRGGVTEIFRKNNLVELEKYLKLYAEHARQHALIEGDILLIYRHQKEAHEIIHYFEDTKLKFIHFNNAENAAQIAKAAEFDLVITNIILSGTMSGFALIREVRNINDKMYRVPILAISDVLNMSQKLELLRAGVNDYIEKPILLEELRARVKNLLHNKKLFDMVETQKFHMETIANHDQLTGLYNRQYLSSIANKVIEEAHRYKFPISLLIVDIDHFKKVNDIYGHSIGDAVLKALAGLLMKVFRGSDTPIRLGGEEFIILLPHCNATDAISRAQSFRLKIYDLYPAGIRISASIGISEIPVNTCFTYEYLFAAADQALYAAKSSGRNCVAFKDIVDVKLTHRPLINLVKQDVEAQ